MTSAKNNDQPTFPDAAPAAAHRSAGATRVAELRARIESGDYVVDPAAIADKLVDAGFPDAAVADAKDQNEPKFAGERAN